MQAGCVVHIFLLEIKKITPHVSMQAGFASYIRHMNPKTTRRVSMQVGYARTPPTHRDAVHLLTQGGSLLALRRDLRTPFVSWLAQQVAAGACVLSPVWPSI